MNVPARGDVGVTGVLNGRELSRWLPCHQLAGGYYPDWTRDSGAAMAAIAAGILG